MGKRQKQASHRGGKTGTHKSRKRCSLPPGTRDMQMKATTRMPTRGTRSGKSWQRCGARHSHSAGELSRSTAHLGAADTILRVQQAHTPAHNQFTSTAVPQRNSCPWAPARKCLKVPSTEHETPPKYLATGKRPQKVHDI